MRDANSAFQQLRPALIGLALSMFAGTSAVSMAGTVELSPGPPAATISVAPNLVLTFDDSGSMTWRHMPDNRPYSNVGWGAGSGQTEAENYAYPGNTAVGPYLCAGVITPGITDTSDPRSWSMNGVYFNPDNDYDPPVRADGSPMPDASFTGAWVNGYKVNRPTNPVSAVNYTQNLSTLSFCGNKGAGYYTYTAAVSTLPVNGSGQLTAQAITNLYTPGNWTWVWLPAKDQQKFANWFSYYRTRTMASVSSVSHAFQPFNDNVRVAWQNINANTTANPWLTTATSIYKFVDSAATNNVRTKFYNWLFAMPDQGGTPNRTAALRVGEYFKNRAGANDNNPYWDRDVGKELVCRQNYHIQMTDGMWNGDTPTQGAINDRAAISSLPDGTGSFSLSDNESKIVWNEGSNTVETMADIAFRYWATDLQAGVTGASLFATKANRLKVTSNIPDQSTTLFNKPLVADTDPRTNKEIYWNPVNDPATWPHLVQYMIGFGASGTLSNNATTYRSLRIGATAWPVPKESDPDNKMIDDMWHAALNSRGVFFTASNPAALSKALQNIINSIVSRNTTSVSGSLGSAVLTEGAVTYQAGYDTNDWKGSLTANAVNTDGTISAAAVWNGRSLLDTRAKAGDSRVILTSKAAGAGSGVAFRDAVVSAINAVDSGFGTGSTGTNRLAWLRGDQSKDGTSFRQRNSVFGAVVSAQTLYVAQPNGGYSNNWPTGSAEAAGAASGKSYEKFRADHAKRAPTVYVAANDGMLHAFDATTPMTSGGSVDITPSPGAERWAYVPYSVFGRLSGWSSLDDFKFMPSVDGTPVSRDVYFSSGSNQGWHTILVAGLRLGGRGVYALDITEPSATEGGTSGKVMGPADKVLWEFNSDVAASGADNSANLGYTYGRPNIGRLANGRWVVLVPGGYFPTGSTEPAASNAFSSLFVLDAQTGVLLRELKTPTSVGSIAGTIESYGLTTPVFGDYNSDQVDDVAIAGDLQGNLWRFDLKDSNPANWRAELLYRPEHPGDQPITVMPRLFPDAVAGGFMVVFGTGKYLGGIDNVIDANTKVQSIYGIRDAGSAGQTPVVGSGSLVEQTMVEFSGIRGLSSHPVPAKNASGVAIRGWHIDLKIDGAKGERVVVDATAIFTTNQAIVSTLIPQNNDPCDPAPRGALLVLDALTGQTKLGGDYGSVTGWPDGFLQAGLRVKNPPTSGFLPVSSAMGGGLAYVPGLVADTGNEAIDGKAPSLGIPVWRRRSWRVLNNAD